MEDPALVLQNELSSRLSSAAEVFLSSSDEFESSNLRFTEYERPVSSIDSSKTLKDLRLIVAKTYLVAVRPGTGHDVAATVKYAQDKGILFSPRAGHHCVTTTMRHLKNGILIDMRSLNGMVFDEEKRHVTVGGGVITDDFVRFLESRGMEVSECETESFDSIVSAILRENADVGSCPTTGVIGVAFGAGLGRLQGKYGFLHDNMISCKLVLADGSIVTASEKSHADLFWAIRGAGHNFGIALEATFQVYPQANGGMHCTWDLQYTLDQCDEVFTVLNNVHEIMPPELAIFIVWNRQSKSGQKVWSPI